MAYLNYLFSIPEARATAFYQDQNASLQVTRSTVCSHLIAYSIPIQPLGELLDQALDGGEIFHASFSHPFRVPKIHSVDSVDALYPRLKEDWDQSHVEHPFDENDWYEQQIKKVVELFEWAYLRDELVLSFLQPSPGFRPNIN